MCEQTEPRDPAGGGRRNHIPSRRTCGRWDACSMRWPPLVISSSNPRCQPTPNLNSAQLHQRVLTRLRVIAVGAAAFLMLTA
eukprot:4076327-Amphidinium_carterae.1